MDRYLLAIPLLAALVIGGGTKSGLASDAIIQIVAIIISTIVCIRCVDRNIDRRLFWFMIAVGFAITFQVLPVATEATRSAQGVLPNKVELRLPEAATITLGLGRTIEVAGYYLTLCFFLTALLKIRFRQIYGLIPFYLAGVILNLIAGVFQYSYGSQSINANILPYDIKAGFFVNVNHYSSLIFTSIPIAFVYFVMRGEIIILAVYITSALLLLLAAGSMAGVLIGLAITVLSIIILFQRNRAGVLTALVGSIILGAYSIGVWTRLQVEEMGIGHWRLEFAKNTMEGIRENFLLGIGYGNFETGYTRYERSEMISNRYINHAHNEYLELAFEGGIIAIILMAVFVVIFVARSIEVIEKPLQKAAVLSIIFILVHSAVDYPLRTMGMAFSFCLFIAFIFHRRDEELRTNEVRSTHQT